MLGKNSYLFFSSSGDKGWFLVRSHSHGLLMTSFLLCPYVAFSLHMNRLREKSLVSLPPLITMPSYQIRALHLQHYLTLITSLEALSSNKVMVEVRLCLMNFGDACSVHNSPINSCFPFPCIAS